MLSYRFANVVMALCAIVPVMADHLFARKTEGNNLTVGPMPPESYVRETTALTNNLLRGHIALMSVSWIGAFPICRY
jgi:hypothetical protein